LAFFDHTHSDKKKPILTRFSLFLRQQCGNDMAVRRRKIRVRRYSDSNRPALQFVVNSREAGKRKRRFFETKEQASAFAAFKNAELQSNGIEHAEFPTSLRIMAQECANRLSEYKKRGSDSPLTIKDATDYLIAHLKASEKSCSAAQLVNELIAAKTGDGASQRHLSDLHSRLNIFAKKFDGRMVATITSAEIDDWLRSLEVSAVTRNHYRRLIVLAFNFAVQRGYATDNPAEKTAKAKEPKADIGILSVTQAARLLESATPGILPYIAIGLFAGLRRAEIERLDWSEVDFDSGLIEVTAQNSKTAQRRFVTIQPNLREWLLPLRQHKGNVTPQNCFRELFEQARAAAGIVEWPENALRHSFASYHLAHFKNAAATALELGHHDSRITFAHYRELVKPKEGERYWSIRPARTEKIVQIVAQR
jgi:integrase